jgi:hypothetical protein
MDGQSVQETWNKKRIFFALFVLALALVGFYFLKTRILISPSQGQSVEGISDERKFAEPTKTSIQDTVKEKINNLKEQVLGLNVMEIASSSPQVQKIINDIKSWEEYPANQVKGICKQICGCSQ